jgi:hypothetical protein
MSITRRQPIVQAVLVPDELTLDRQLSALTTRNRWQVGITARPQTRQLSWIVADILAEFGVSRHVSGGQAKDVDGDLLLAGVNLASHDTSFLVVHHAERLQASLLTELATLAAGAGASLWLLYVGPPDDLDNLIDEDQQRWLAGWNAAPPHTFEQVKCMLAGCNAPHLLVPPTPPCPAGPRPETFAHLPTSDFPTFYADCAATLDYDTFEELAECWLDVHESMPSWERRTPTAAELARWLRSRFTRTTTGRMLVDVRATQVALFHAGWHLHVDLERFLSAAPEHGATRTLTDADWEALRAYRLPYRPSACVAVDAGLSIHQIQSLTVADVDDVTLLAPTPRGTERIKPRSETAAAFIRSLRLQRELTGAAPGDPLFADLAGRPVRDRMLTGAVTAPAAEVGVTVASRRVDRQPVTDETWLKRLGLTIQQL